MHTRLVAAIIVALALTATGCTSDDSKDSASSTGKSDKPADPKSLDGACSLLLGPADHLVDDALATGAAVADGGGVADVDRATTVQNSLFTLVADGSAKLRDPAGQLVDYLDDPVAYQTKSGVDPIVTDAVKAIKDTCKG